METELMSDFIKSKVGPDGCLYLTSYNTYQLIQQLMVMEKWLQNLQDVINDLEQKHNNKDTIL
jgi:hypothetical protein